MKLATNRNLTIDRVCNCCAAHYVIFVNRNDFMNWLSGHDFIQNCMGYLSDNERELLISGTCGSCFEKMFSSFDSGE